MGPLLIASSEAAANDARRARSWSSAWIALLALGALRAAWPLVIGHPDSAYQAHLSASSPGPGFVVRLVAQYRGHLSPLLSGLPRIDHAATALGLAGFALGFAAAARGVAGDAAARRLAALAGLGLAWAGLAYAPFVVSPYVVRPERTQMLSAAGVGLFLAAGVLLIARATRGGLAVAAVLGAFVVAQGTDRTLALQRHWNRESLYRVQRNALRRIVAAAPDLEPGTFVILLGGAGAFKLDLGFRHAMKYLYGGRAVGHAPDAAPYLYETRFDAQGIVNEPWPVLRGPWHEPAARYRYEDVVVFVADGSGGMALASEWPERLPPLPPGARYAPAQRIRSDASRASRPLLR